MLPAIAHASLADMCVIKSLAAPRRFDMSARNFERQNPSPR